MAKKVAPKKEKKVKGIPFKEPPVVKLTSFSFGATIPTQSFGNITTRIEVQSDSYEAAREFATPKILELYVQYCEIKPTFMSKITVEEKVVTPSTPQADPAASSLKPAPVPQSTSVNVEKPKSEAVLKAEKAIGLAMSEDAANAIQEQIEKSVKIAAEDKPALYTLCLKKKKELRK